jgi:PAS domain S-box-containing protein
MKLLLVEGLKRTPRQFWENLEAKGYSISPQQNASDCLPVLASENDCAVLVDVDYTKRGVEAIRDIRKVFPDVLILALASQEKLVALDKALEEGASDFLIKHPDLSYLEEIPYSLSRAKEKRDLRRQKELLQQRVNGLLLTMNDSQEGLFIIGADGKVLYANRVMLERLGYEAKDFIDQSADIFLPAVNDSNFTMREIPDLPIRRFEGRVPLRKKDGSEIPLPVSIAQFIDVKGEKSLIGMCHPLSLESYEEKTAISEYILHITQDLKGPLAAMIGYIEIAASLIPDGAEPNQSLSLQRIDALARHLLDLITNHTNALEIDAGKLEVHKVPLPLKQVLELAVQDRKPAASAKNIEIVLQTAEDLPSVPIDIFQMERALANMISNAISLSPAGGQITVVSETRGRELRIAVKDNGAGITGEELPYLFDRTKRSRRRGGDIDTVGLYVAERIIKIHGGRIDVESDALEGNALIICLPIEG